MVGDGCCDGCDGSEVTALVDNRVYVRWWLCPKSCDTIQAKRRCRNWRCEASAAIWCVSNCVTEHRNALTSVELFDKWISIHSIVLVRS